MPDGHKHASVLIERLDSFFGRKPARLDRTFPDQKLNIDLTVLPLALCAPAFETGTYFELVFCKRFVCTYEPTLDKRHDVLAVCVLSLFDARDSLALCRAELGRRDRGFGFSWWGLLLSLTTNGK